MRRSIWLAGVLPFVSAFLGGILAFGLIAAPQATAQSSQPAEVRASAFILVAPDGTTLARIGSGGIGNGNLTLFDSTGTQRVVLGGNGGLNVFDLDGSPIFRAGRTFEASPGGSELNGVMLGPGGSISSLP